MELAALDEVNIAVGEIKIVEMAAGVCLQPCPTWRGHEPQRRMQPRERVSRSASLQQLSAGTLTNGEP